MLTIASSHTPVENQRLQRSDRLPSVNYPTTAAACGSMLSFWVSGLHMLVQLSLKRHLTKYSRCHLTAMLDEGCGRGVSLLSSYTVGQSSCERFLHMHGSMHVMCACKHMHWHRVVE